LSGYITIQTVDKVLVVSDYSTVGSSLLALLGWSQFLLLINRLIEREPNIYTYNMALVMNLATPIRTDHTTRLYW